MPSCTVEGVVAAAAEDLVGRVVAVDDVGEVVAGAVRSVVVQIEVFDPGPENKADIRFDAVDIGRQAGRFVDDVACVVDEVDVVAGAADHRVGTQAALERVVSGKTRERIGEIAATDVVVAAVTRADELVGVSALVGEVLDVGHRLDRQSRHERLDRIGAGTRSFYDHIGDIVDDVGIVAGKTDHRIGIEAAVEDVVVSRSRTADQKVVACAAVENVVAGAAEDQVVAEAAGDVVVDPFLADDEVVRRRSRQVDAVDGIGPVGRIGAADHIVFGAELVSINGGAVEVDALDAGLRDIPVEVVDHRDLLGNTTRHGVVYDQVAVLRSGIVVSGVQRGHRPHRKIGDGIDDREAGDRIDDLRHKDRDAIEQSIIPGFVDDVVAVTKCERVGVVTVTAVESVGPVVQRRVDEG